MVSTRRGRGGGALLRCLVTGGAGFLGRHIVDQLLESGRYEVAVFDIRGVPGDTRSGLTYITGDLTKPDQVAAVCKGMDLVVHVATAAPTAANAQNQGLMRAVNVDGTRHVIDACVAEGVPRLVYTSSASVVFDGRDLSGVDEAQPYASKDADFYTLTKIEGEKLVLEANGRGGLATVALRPSGIFGEYDNYFVPTTIDKARQGKMKYVIGSGTNLNDWTYAGNVAQAHLEAADALSGPACPLAGHAYFITNNDPRTFWGFLGNVTSGLGYGRPNLRLPFALIYTIALLVQYVIAPLMALFGRRLTTELTPFRIKLATANRTFSTAAAQRDFGYKPAVSVDEGLQRTLQYFKHLHASAKQA